MLSSKECSRWFICDKECKIGDWVDYYVTDLFPVDQ